MANFISDFFENREWLGLVQQNPTTLALEIGGIPISNSYTIATMPDATAVELGTVINIPKSEFINSGGGAAAYMPGWGIYLMSDGTIWRPYGKQLFAVVGTGTESAPVVNDSVVSGASTTTVFALPSGSPSIPAELMYVGLRIDVEMIMGKGATSTAGSIPHVTLGTSGANLATNAIMAIGGTMSNATDLRQTLVNSFVTVTSTTEVSGPIGTGAGAALIPNAASGTINQNTGVAPFQTVTAVSFTAAAKNYIAPCFWSSGTTDTHDLFYFAVYIS